MKLYLMRHFAHSGKLGAYYGRTDLHLKDQSLRPLNLQRAISVYTSPLLRCLQSAKVMGIHNPVLLNDAREIDFGEWEGLTFEDIEQTYPEEINNWVNNHNFKFPGGEGIMSFKQRIEMLIADLLGHKQDLLLISHGGVIRSIICILLGLDFNKSLSFKVDFGSLSCLEVYADGGGVLVFLNNTEMDTWPKLLS